MASLQVVFPVLEETGTSEVPTLLMFGADLAEHIHDSVRPLPGSKPPISMLVLIDRGDSKVPH